VHRVARRPNLTGGGSKHREWFSVVEALYPCLGSPKRIHPPLALGALFHIVMFKDRQAPSGLLELDYEDVKPQS
jgi:hypothetical protein